MNPIRVGDGWYGFSTLQGDWGVLHFSENPSITTSRGLILRPIKNKIPDKPIYLVGATYKGQLVMGGQSHAGHGTWLYRRGEWWNVSPNSFGMNTCAFSQDGRFFYAVSSGSTGFWVDLETDQVVPFLTNFFVDGIRAVVPPGNEIILGNTTKYDPITDTFEYITFSDGTVVGQGQTGVKVTHKGKSYIIEVGDTKFIRCMYDGFNFAITTVKELELTTVTWFFNVDELHNFEAPVEVIPAIGKPCWLTWFEFNGAIPGALTPWSGWLDILAGGVIWNKRGNQFAQWIQGPTVEDIERQIAEVREPVVAYWDSRNWPSYPKNLFSTDWLGLQAYCYANETPAEFEANMRKVIESVPTSSVQSQIALICQCYTSNVTLTSNLKALVPVYARLARDYPRITHLLVFTDQGRPTGLNDHPELIKPWSELYDGITGEPEVPDSVMPEDVYAIVKQVHEKYAQGCIDANPNDMEAASRQCTQMIVEQILFSFPLQGYCWKSADPNRPPSKDSAARLFPGVFWGWDLFQSSSINGPRNLNQYPPPVNDITGQYPIFPGDPKVPGFEPRDWLGLIPPVGKMDILVFEYTNPAKRSDPLGCLVKFEIESTNPVEEIRLELNDGDLPFVWRHTEGKDGRYYRAIAFKVTVPGQYNLTISARDNVGVEVMRVLPLTVEN